ncbi:MAG: 50S ribosomal protein L7Ae [Candidatus Micrarchaeales archaeon]|jgi:LSU ribosomal protein L7AE|uniref:Large ribosomal subunit protein eL8 n=1 Tax=Candidatus Micrarchaeum acidiphilum ARMAN-2 TaxID=425595 RepID=C7DI37_MICA2|nr:MAG: ribosomal protein L7Ae/L30e/S12e/Gadd45 [Candidatus Micrarchaeum acidiphilum ARMAN-2]MCW6160860.1 50S ribosomal protein L7Ae [Candidatus Micrarchaeales archaeon]
MSKSYVKFEVSKDVMSKTYEALQLARQSGKIKKGVNEATKSIERGAAKLVVMAEDVEPEEVIMHLPQLCEQKKIPFTYVASKKDLGKSIGLSVQCAAVAVEELGGSAHAINDIIAQVTGVSGKPKEQKESKEQKPAEHEHKQEKPQHEHKQEPEAKKEEPKKEKSEEKHEHKAAEQSE